MSREVRILPIGDVHLGSLYHNEKAWMDFRDWVCKQNDTYLVLVGDMINNNTRSSKGGTPFEDVIRPREQKKLMQEMLKPLAEKGIILAAVPGNHEQRSEKDADDDPMFDIMCKLDLEDVYRPNMAFINLMIGSRLVKGQEKTAATYAIAMTHGSGGGALTGSAVNKNERFSYGFEGIDCLITGHTHKGSITKPGRYVFNPKWDHLLFKSVTCVTVCSWMEYGGYGMRKQYLPTTSAAHGGQSIYFSGDRFNKRIWTEW